MGLPIRSQRAVQGDAYSSRMVRWPRLGRKALSRQLWRLFEHLPHFRKSAQHRQEEGEHIGQLPCFRSWLRLRRMQRFFLNLVARMALLHSITTIFTSARIISAIFTTAVRQSSTTTDILHCIWFCLFTIVSSLSSRRPAVEAVAREF